METIAVITDPVHDTVWTYNVREVEGGYDILSSILDCSMLSVETEFYYCDTADEAVTTAQHLAYEVFRDIAKDITDMPGYVPAEHDPILYFPAQQ